MRFLGLFALLVLLAGCGGGTQRNGTPSTSSRPPAAAKPPSSPKPTLSGVSGGPPAAWLESERGSFWLGYSSYCWKTVCADFMPPSCKDSKHTPTIILRRGETVTAHLAFEPTELTLSYIRGTGATIGDQTKLEPSSTPSWDAERDGPFSLFARASAGDASYVACVKFE